MAGIKCVIWDLDNTLWDGTCLEDDSVELRPGIRDVLQALADRGIVQSIASKNEESALRFVEDFGLADFFVYPHVNWEPKESNIRAIAGKLNIGLDAVAFVDDNPFERESVEAVLPEVLTIDAADYRELPAHEATQLHYDTPEARSRGQMYVEESRRREEEESHEGRKEAFLMSLEMEATPRVALDADLARVSELVTRTNQFNSTGIRYSDEEILAFHRDPSLDFHICSLVDRYGDYGRCGVALVRRGDDAWDIEILLVSCRVAGRGLGTAFISYLSHEAIAAGARQLRARYIRTDRNRQIGLLYKIIGFDRDDELSDEGSSVFSYDLSKGPASCPAWVRMPAIGEGEVRR